MSEHTGAGYGALTENSPCLGQISYQLLIDVRQPVRCAVGRLGEIAFPARRYVYPGSAKRAPPKSNA